MNKLSRRLTKPLTTEPETPTWWPIAQIVILVVFVFYLFFQMAAERGSESQVGVDPSALTTSPVIDLTGPSDPSETTPAPSDPVAPGPAPADPSPLAPGTQPAKTVTLSSQHGEIQVEADAHALAQAAIAAIFSNDFATVRMAQGTTPPVVPGLDSDYLVAPPSVDLVLDDRVQLTFVVTPKDGSRERRVTVTVVREDGMWAYQGDPA
jgi:hypothetical protein